MTSTALRTSSLPDFAEDRQAAWVPDALGWADAEGIWRTVYDSGRRHAALEAIEGVVPKRIETISVPKPDGSATSAPVLGPYHVARLHLATDPLRDAANATLAPGVCGYRRGAEPGYSYSFENLRFHEFSQAEADGAAFVVMADVARFFENVPWALVLDSAANFASDADLAELHAFAADSERDGLTCLPAGYADSRLLSNLVLHRVDEVLQSGTSRPGGARETRFTRWVDDYRIFVDSEQEAVQSLDDLRNALAVYGLRLNEAKTEVAPAAQFIASAGNSLQSVYHPDIETPEQVRAALRSVFLEAAAEPTAKRRSLRFTLPRLAKQEDDVAVDWALKMLHQIPWDAPRLCRYLGAFAHRGDVARAVESILIRAASTPGDEWLACRVAALACHSGIDADVASPLADMISATTSDSLWALGLRALSLAGHEDEVLRVLGEGVRDHRAAAAALTDLGELTSFQPDIQEVLAGPTGQLLAQGPAPRPALDAIL